MKGWVLGLYKKFFFAAVTAILSTQSALAEESSAQSGLEDGGIELSAALTNIYQANVSGGLSTNDGRGRFVGRYDLELSADLAKLFGIEGGTLNVAGWGGWPDIEGISDHSVGSVWGTNALAYGNRTLDIVELYYEGPLFWEDLTISIGKLDMTGIFDATAYADDECSQFLNTSLVDDPTIPFPSHGLGAVIRWDITDSWYLTGGIADAEADSAEAGFTTAFGQEDYFFYAVETGHTISFNSDKGPMQGTYRVGVWIDYQDKTHIVDSSVRRGDAGFYTSCDQMLYRENADDDQGLGGFFRYGWADGKYNSITNFVSFGFQYKGLFDGRNEDVLGAGYSRGYFSNDDSATYPDNYESVTEVYYNMQIADWLALSPNIQYVVNPSDGSGTQIDDAFVIGLRASMSF